MCTLVHFKASFFLASCPNETNSKTRTLLKPDLKAFSTRKFQHEDSCKRELVLVTDTGDEICLFIYLSPFFTLEFFTQLYHQSVNLRIIVSIFAVCLRHAVTFICYIKKNVFKTITGLFQNWFQLYKRLQVAYIYYQCMNGIRNELTRKIFFIKSSSTSSYFLKHHQKIVSDGKMLKQKGFFKLGAKDF